MNYFYLFWIWCVVGIAAVIYLFVKALLTADKLNKKNNNITRGKK